MALILSRAALLLWAALPLVSVPVAAAVDKHAPHACGRVELA